MDAPLLRRLNCEEIRVLAAEQRTAGATFLFQPHANNTELVEDSKCVRIQVVSSRGPETKRKKKDLMRILCVMTPRRCSGLLGQFGFNLLPKGMLPRQLPQTEMDLWLQVPNPDPDPDPRPRRVGGRQLGRPNRKRF